MRTLTYLVATSLDGFIAAPDGDFSAFPVDGDSVAAHVRDHPDTIPAFAHGVLGIEPTGAEFDTVLMGWSTYAAGFAVTRSPYPHLRQIVFSRTRAAADAGAGVEVVDADPLDVVRDLKAGPGTGIWLCGGGRLAGALLPAIDELVLKINPIVFGRGIPLFGPDPSIAEPRAWKLAESERFDDGVVRQRLVAA